MMKLLKQIILALIFVPFLANGSTYTVQVIESSAQSLRLKIEFAEPQLLEINGSLYANYQKSQLIIADDGFVLPHLVKFFNLAIDQQVNPRITHLHKQTIKIEHYYRVTSDSLQPFHIEGLASAQYLGQYGDLPVHALHIFPIRYNLADKTLEWVRSMEIELGISAGSVAGMNYELSTPKNPKLVNSLFVNGAQRLYAPRQLNTVQSSEPQTGQKFNPILAKTNIFKITVKKTGFYKITHEDLFIAGYPLETVNPKKLSLYYRGVEVPIYFSGAEDNRFDENDYFEFWGEKNEKTFYRQFPDLYADPFSDESIYWLVENTINGRRLIEESGGLAQTGVNPIFEPYAYTETLHFEEDKYHENFGHSSSNLNRPSYEIDHWYFDSGIRAPEGGAYSFYLPYPFESGANVIVRAAFRGKSYYSYPTNLLQGHKVELKLRGKDEKAKRIGLINPTDKWRDQTMRIISNADSASKISQSLLQHGINRLEVDMFQSGVTDIVLLNWFEISYLRKYRADNNFIKFSVDADFFDNRYVKLGDVLQFNVDGFVTRDIDIYKLGISKIVNSQIDKITEDLVTSFRVTFQDEIFDSNIQYVAVTDKAKLKPFSVQPYKPWKSEDPSASLLSTSNTADYLIITHDLLMQNSMRLKELKEADGYKVEIVNVESLYDIFNYGTKSPLAIKEFIRYVAENWNQTYPLKYVVFVGDASYDYKGIIKSGTDMVPTFLFQTEQFGSAGSDYWYALLDDDYIPDVIVSRIPASTIQQLLNYLDKVENYSQGSPMDAWRNTVLFIAGNDASGSDRELLTNQPIFREQSLRLMDMQLPDPIFTHLLNTVKDESIEGFDPNFGSTTDLIEYFDDGVSFINFLGHGGGSIWADVNLLNLNDIDRLNNGYKLPFISSMTCFTGAFENPGRQGLAEKLLLSEEKGAIAVLASTGLGWKYNDMALEWGLFEFLWDQNLTFGEAVDLMKIYYLANPIYYTENGSFYTLGYYSLYKSMVSQYNLLGDPALKLQKPLSALKIDIDDYSPSPGDSIKIKISGGLGSGNGQLEIADRRTYRYFENNFTFQPGGVDFNFVLPDSISDQRLFIKAYVSDGLQDASGSAEIGVEQTIIKSISTSPLTPKIGEPIAFNISLRSAREIEFIKLFNFRDFDNLSTYNFNVTTQKVADTLFQSNVDFPGFIKSGQKFFDILVRESSGSEKLYHWRKLQILDDRPDLILDTKSLSYAGSERLQISFKVRNDSKDNLSEVKVACYTDQGIENDLPFAEPIFNLNAGEEKTIAVDFDSTRFLKQRTFKIVLDPENRYEERSESNNMIQRVIQTDHLWIRSEIGTTIGGFSNEPVPFYNLWNFFVPKETLSKSSVVKFTELPLADLFKEGDQVGLKSAKLAGGLSHSAVNILIANYDEQLQFSGILSSELEVGEDSLSNISFFRYDNFLKLWVQNASNLDGKKISTAINRPGLYTVFHSSDDKEPLIEISSNGRPLTENILVINKPTIAILLQDESGVDLNNSFILKLDNQTLVMNGKPLNTEEVNFPDSLQNAKSISILATPKLSSGTHSLYVEVTDVNGNRSQQEINFQVSEGFDIKVFGNYPNPFSDKTILSFFVNSDNEIDDFSVKIYTTSGRLVRSKMLDLDESVATDNIKLPEHHELIWFGDDDDGNEVANGVYFAVITGKYKGKTVKHTLKMAKLQ